MRIHSLTLAGFCGIRDGLGRDRITFDLEQWVGDAALVAIIGPNGRGKTTLMDNLHPYLTMPSRAGGGVGGFSYYDQVYLPEAEKELIWSLAGRRYRSHVVIRSAGRKRTEAYLFEQEEGRWKPVILDDGTRSDGKIETYTHCVDTLCGRAETFFTSVFSAQGKRALYGYRTAEIKALLADLLGQDTLSSYGQQASEICNRLKTALTTLRLELTTVQTQAQQIAVECQRLAHAPGGAAQMEERLQQSRRERDKLKTQLAHLMFQREQVAVIEQRRLALQNEQSQHQHKEQAAWAEIQAQEQRERQRLNQLELRIQTRRQREMAHYEWLMAQRATLQLTLLNASRIHWAIKRQPLAEIVHAQRCNVIAHKRQQLELTQNQHRDIERLCQQIEQLEQRVGHAWFNHESIKRRLGLINNVPCAGSDLQGRCQLLGDVRDAQTILPQAMLQLDQLEQERATLLSSLQQLRQQTSTVDSSRSALRHAEKQGQRAHARLTRLGLLAARAGDMTQAQTHLAAIATELAELINPPAVLEKEDEQQERRQIAYSFSILEERRTRLQASAEHEKFRIEAAFLALPPAYDSGPEQATAQALSEIETRCEHLEQERLQLEREVQMRLSTQQRHTELLQQMAQMQIGMTNIEEKLSVWSLFSRCMSKDGLIALAIDAAAPAIAAWANELLLACYGPRFTLVLQTLVETGKGDTKEGFEIIVHDGESDESKNVVLMSGGERVWINECLTRALALYIAQQAGSRYATLFTDEIDGALDPERKRMLMAMKRAVLRLGGYEQEFFVSQTPELNAMADAVIDLESMVCQSSI